MVSPKNSLHANVTQIAGQGSARAKLAAAYGISVRSNSKPAYFLMTANPKQEIEEKDGEIIALERTM